MGGVKLIPLLFDTSTCTKSSRCPLLLWRSQADVVDINCIAYEYEKQEIQLDGSHKQETKIQKYLHVHNLWIQSANSFVSFSFGNIEFWNIFFFFFCFVLDLRYISFFHFCVVVVAALLLCIVPVHRTTTNGRQRAQDVQKEIEWMNNIYWFWLFFGAKCRLLILITPFGMCAIYLAHIPPSCINTDTCFFSSIIYSTLNTSLHFVALKSILAVHLCSIPFGGR